MNGNKTAGAGRVIQFPCFLVGELEPTQGHMAKGGNGPEHSATAPGLVLSPDLPDFQERMALSKELYSCSYGRCL